MLHCRPGSLKLPGSACWDERCAPFIIMPNMSVSLSLLALTLGTFSTSDEEGLCEENHVSEALLQAQAPTPPVLVEREASGAGDGSRQAAKGSWAPAVVPYHPSQTSKQVFRAIWGFVVIFLQR